MLSRGWLAASHSSSATSITRTSRSPFRALIPSSIIVMQKRAAHRKHVRAGLNRFARTFLVHSLTRRLINEAHAAAAAAAKTLSAAALHLYCIPGCRDLHQLPRRVVYAVLPS